MKPRMLHVPRPPRRPLQCPPVVTLSRCVQHCPLPVSPVRDYGALLTLSGAAALSSPPGAPPGRGRSRAAQQRGTGGRWRAEAQTPSPNRRSGRGAAGAGPVGRRVRQPLSPGVGTRRGRSPSGGAVPGEGRGQPLRAGTGKRRSRPVGAAAIAEPRATRGKRGVGGAAGCPEAAGSGAAPGPPQQFPRWAPGMRSGDAGASGKHCGTPAGPPRPAPPRSVRNRARPVPPRPGSGSERSDAVQCGAVRCGLRCVRHRPRGRRAWSHQELPRVFLPVPSGRGAGAGAAGRSPGTPARYRFCFRGRRRFRSNGGRVPPAPGIPHLPPPHKSRRIHRWRH